jgi:hypothetical protein
MIETLIERVVGMCGIVREGDFDSLVLTFSDGRVGKYNVVRHLFVVDGVDCPELEPLDVVGVRWGSVPVSEVELPEELEDVAMALGAAGIGLTNLDSVDLGSVLSIGQIMRLRKHLRK